ncbi:MAG: amidohydrolase [Gammaproteobacteria bacterium]|nr:MAG: amidohydrolase [Gammaproteobacteria bacterium]
MHGMQLRYRSLFLILVLLLTCLQNIWADTTTIYTAKKIITMDHIQPEATAVAVQNGRIYSVGSLDEVKKGLKAGSYTIDNTFAHNIIVPGLIEAHSHLTMLAVFLAHPYVGYWDFPGLNGAILPAAKTKAEVINHLKEADKKLTDPNAVLFAWGYDPIYFNNEDLTAADLDQISKTRPIFVLNASEHIGYVNSVLLSRAHYNAQTHTPGVMKDKTGQPTGVLKEMAAAGPVVMLFFNQLFSPDSFKTGLYGLGDTAHRLGLTTFSELLFGGPGENDMVTVLKQAANDAHFPLRMVIVYDGILLTSMNNQSSGQGMSHLEALIQQNSNKLRFGQVKFVSDGSIQGYTARLEWPGYFNGAPNGIFNTPTPQLKEAALPFWKAGYPIHVHVNGNQATESALDVLAYLQTVAPRRAQLFVLEHDQLSSPEQFRRTRQLGAYVNLFANHIYYWGDQHYAILLGPDRANRMDAAGEAKRQGVLFSLHTDSPVTPLGPLHSMWVAMNRVTASGRVLGANQRISAEDALRAVTLNAAYLLNLQNEIGSIEIGKRADFTVLGRNPLTEPAMTVKDIPVVATIQDGVIYPIKS